MVLSLNLSEVRKITLQAARSLSTGMEFSVLDQKGIYLANVDFQKVKVREISPIFHEIRTTVSQGNTRLEFRRSTQDYLAWVKLLEGPGWYLAVKQPVAMAYASVDEITGLITGTLGFWLLAALLLTLWILNTLNRTIKSLTSHALAIRQGHYETRALFSTWKEFRQFTETINSMVTAIRYRDKELRDKNAELERFTYTVSHDLKSPLITVKGFSGLIGQDLERGDLEKAGKDLVKINNAADKMTDLLQDLLEISRIGRIIKPPVQVSMGDLVQEVRSILEIPLKSVNLLVTDTWPQVFCDRFRIKEVWQNLVENALKYKHPEKSVTLWWGWEPRDGKAVFYLKDNGIGIEQPYRTRVFGLFEKLDQKSEGTGIGLALAKRIIEFHGGQIWIEDGAEGGCCFCFTLGEPGAAEAAPQN